MSKEKSLLKVELDWELGVFYALRYGYRKLFRKEESVSPNRVELRHELDTLALFARALTGRNIELRTAETVGGRQGDVFLLPAAVDLLADWDANRRFYLYRIIHMYLGEEILPPADPKERFVVESVAGFRAAVRALEAYPALDPWLQAALPRMPEPHRLHGYLLQALAGWKQPSPAIERLTTLPFPEAVRWVEQTILPKHGGPLPKHPMLLWGQLYAPVTSQSAGSGHDLATHEGSTPTGEEHVAPPRENVKVVQVDEEAWKKKVYAPQFEAVEALEEFDGNIKPMDGSNELDDHQEAMDDLDMREIIRTGEATDSLYKADIMLETTVADMGDQNPLAHGIPYDEWDAARRRYKEGWCTVYPDVVRNSDPTFVPRTIEANRTVLRQLETRWQLLRQELRARPRQTDGADIDLDAVVDAHATRLAGHTPSDRLYVRTVREQRDVAIEILMDLSLSTDSYVDGYRILDVATESIALLCESLGETADEIGIGAFYSNTRHSCHYLQIKAANESWKKAGGRLGCLEPAGYTRIGPAIRHATSLLSKRPARRKCLLLITDGKPNDYDRYEGRYGVADVKQAIREAGQEDILVHALAIERRAKDHLPVMLGHRNYRILPRPSDLVHGLSDLFLNLQK